MSIPIIGSTNLFVRSKPKFIEHLCYQCDHSGDRNTSDGRCLPRCPIVEQVIMNQLQSNSALEFGLIREVNSKGHVDPNRVFADIKMSEMVYRGMLALNKNYDCPHYKARKVWIRRNPKWSG